MRSSRLGPLLHQHSQLQQKKVDHQHLKPVRSFCLFLKSILNVSCTWNETLCLLKQMTYVSYFSKQADVHDQFPCPVFQIAVTSAADGVSTNTALDISHLVRKKVRSLPTTAACYYTQSQPGATGGEAPHTLVYTSCCTLLCSACTRPLLCQIGPCPPFLVCSCCMNFLLALGCEDHSSF